MIKLTTSILFLLFILGVIFKSGLSQEKGSIIQGYIFDRSSGEPLENVNVYIANTTWGSSTDKDGYYIIRQIPHGTHELVVSSIGYAYETKEINIKENIKLDLHFKLNPVIYETETTTVEGSIPTEWLEDRDFFEVYFLGSTDFAKDCHIENSEVLDFRRPSKSIFQASALKPLVITNGALGYRLDCILISFTFNTSSNTYSWSVKPKFTELEPKDNEEMAGWIQNRSEAFEGSVYHFLNSFCSKSLPEEGFDIYKVAAAGQKVMRADWHTVYVDYDEYIEWEDYYKNCSLHFENYLHVVYHKNDVSWIGLNYTSISLDEYGYPYEDNPYMIFGEWAKQGIADLLPKNFTRKRK